MKEHKQYQVEPVKFDDYNKETAIQDALGSKRANQRQESGDIRSTNWKKGVSGWRISPSGIEVARFASGVPTSTPLFVGEMYINTATAKVYIATGTSNSGDWALIN